MIALLPPRILDGNGGHLGSVSFHMLAAPGRAVARAIRGFGMQTGADR